MCNLLTIWRKAAIYESGTLTKNLVMFESKLDSVLGQSRCPLMLVWLGHACKTRDILSPVIVSCLLVSELESKVGARKAVWGLADSLLVLPLFPLVSLFPHCWSQRSCNALLLST